MTLPIYSLVIDENINGEAEVNFMALVDKPAIEKNFQLFKEQTKLQLSIQNEDKRIIAGAAMLADTPIYRNDSNGEYYVVFSKETIKQIVEKFFKKGYVQNFNIMHDGGEVVKDVTIFQSFISDSEIGISPMKGYEDAPEGSWFIAAKVDNEEVWNRVKSGELRGFSVEGIFNIKKEKFSKEEAIKKIEDILSCTNF